MAAIEQDAPAPAGPATRARALLQRAAGAIPLTRRELLLLAGAMALGLLIRIAYVLITKDHSLVGDETEYDKQARFIVEGQWFWSTTPFGIPHESLWKPPGYTALVGVLYSVLGADPDRVFMAQAFIGPVTIALTWLLGRRLFNPTVGILAAAIVAVYPFAWQWEVRLYSESLAVPLTLVVLLLVLGRVPTAKRAAVVGALLGVSLLIRPSALLIVPGVLLAWWVTAGFRRGVAMTAVAVGVAVLVVAPWTYRNYEVEGGFVPISAQDGAGFGTFNDDAANDPVYPYKWRALPSRDRDLFDPANAISDTDLRAELQDRMWEYIGDNPEALPKAFFWNGLSRLWDVRRPQRALDEVPFDGRTRSVVIAGLSMYYVLLPLALVALWRLRRRLDLVLPVLGMALAASVIFTNDGGTRYRATLEPLIVVLAAWAALELYRRLRRRLPAAYPAS
jgi:4-amino-4-deoxy-L-arabinose transferase-like glycosyltransferase